MYYKPKEPDNNDAIIMNEIRDIYQESFCSYGYRRMTVALREKGFIVNHKKVSALQKKLAFKLFIHIKKPP
jgi:putative transposase